MDDGWRDRARAELESIKRFWADKYGWAPFVEEAEEHIDLFVTVKRKKEPDREYVLRLRYMADFQTAGRREAFVDPADRDRAGKEYWPTGVRGFNPSRNPPAICLEGTYGFHSDLHKDRDGRVANLNRLLMEIQQCMDA